VKFQLFYFFTNDFPLECFREYIYLEIQFSPFSSTILHLPIVVNQKVYKKCTTIYMGIELYYLYLKKINHKNIEL